MQNTDNQENKEHRIDTHKLDEALHVYEAEKAALFAKFGQAPPISK